MKSHHLPVYALALAILFVGGLWLGYRSVPSCSSALR